MLDIYWEEFCKEINWHFNFFLIHELGYTTNSRADDFSYCYEDEILKIHFNGYFNIDAPDFLDRINVHKGLIGKVTKELKKIYHYDGIFQLDNDWLPF